MKTMVNQSLYPRSYDTNEPLSQCNIDCLSSLLIKSTLSKEECEKNFVFGWQLSQSFYDGAEFYRHTNQKSMAVFMLHQSAEHALKTILRLHMRYVLEIHMIDYLLKSAESYAVQLRNVFKPSDPADQRLLRILDDAYLDARYSNNFQIAEDELLTLTDRIKCIRNVLQDIWKQINKE